MRNPTQTQVGPGSILRPVTCAVMALAAGALLAAIAFAAPLVSILLVGLLLICPLLSWVPFRTSLPPGPPTENRAGRKGPRMTDVLVLTSDACHLCGDAMDALEELAREHPLAIRSVAMDSEEGRALAERHRPPMPPAVLIDGELFSSGRLPRKKLRRLLESA